MENEVDRPVFGPFGFHNGLNVCEVGFLFRHLSHCDMRHNETYEKGEASFHGLTDLLLQVTKSQIYPFEL
jgi:hypothetical protein